MAKKKPRKDPLAMRIFKICYLILVVVSAIIVVLYAAFKILVRPPQVTAPPVVTVLPTDDPNTEEDESQGGSQEIVLQRKQEFHTFLLMGVDDGNGNADTLMVGSYDLKNGKISVVSVPRDTLMDVERKTKKINAAYGIGGVEQLMDELTQVLGFRPDHYIKVDIRAFKDIINNVIGGVSYYVPCDMYHNDGAGFIIDLEEGLQTLNGSQALQLVRYRGYANADLGRIETQQKFMTQVAKQMLSWTTVTKVPELANIFSTYVDTDLSVTELAYFGSAALSLTPSEDFTFATLPGDGDTTYKGIRWYYQLYPQETLELVNATLNPYTTDITLDMTHIFQVK